MQCTNSVIFLVIVKNKGVTGREKRRNEDGRKWDVLNLCNVLVELTLVNPTNKIF